MKSIYGILFLIALFCNASYATHLQGGEIMAAHISGQTYNIKVRIYLDRQQGGGAADAMQEVTVCLGNGTTRNLPRTITSPVPGSRSIIAVDFEQQYTFPTTGIFQISAAVNNRTGGMLNLDNSLETSMFIWTVIDTQVANSTPILPYLAFDAGVRQVFSVDLKPTVADRDSVSVKVHRISKPSPGTCGVRMPDRSYLFPNEISANGTFKVEPALNKLIWKAPEVVGNYLFAMVVSEWRDGVVISESYREGTINVSDKPGETVEIPPYESAEYGNPVTSVPNVSSSEVSMAIEAYPVPTDDFVTVKAYSKKKAVIRLQLIDMSGKTIREISTLSPAISVQERFDMRHLSHGIYIIKADNALESVSQKVVR
ncbi:T9SS type A sorting domain-containing protein [Dyadobacter aurulentus]|uniref:T9SS type A sorting domain-containing protein n=1 Tax=Dyadobacter sp. UC 10 TaxID=2605428 RepID=UPI0011F2FCEA|nr:T9SS type A sorting domain-containing protein [Dyadobacter sp. UC 10]KAA0993718.1 T9SS type A sorting domain-containing protein [Dyadobacter sp. UC 10]